MTSSLVFTAHNDPASFLHVVREDLERNEAEHSLMLGIVSGMRGAVVDAQDATLLVSIHDHGALTLAAMMTPPHPLNLATLSGDVPHEAISVLIRYIIGNHCGVSGVVSTPPLARAFAEKWTAASGSRVRTTVDQRIYSLDAVSELRPAAGHLRLANEHDAELVGRWFAEFDLEAVHNENADQAIQRGHQRIRRGEVYLFEDNEPRSMAARGRPTRNTISVNAVYTPPAWRGRGFATTTVAALSSKLLAEGFAKCVLYTDLANPTSNSIYQRIGYKPVADSEHIIFAPPATVG